MAVGKFNGDTSFVEWYVSVAIDGQDGILFWPTFYTDQEISNTFENSVNLLKRKRVCEEYLDQIVAGLGQTRNYWIARCKLNMPKAYGLTFAQLKTIVEANKFIARPRNTIIANFMVWGDRMNKRFSGSDDKDFHVAHVSTACPDFQKDFTLIINKSTVTSTPFNDDVTNTDTQIKSLRDEALSNRDLCLAATSLDDVKKYAALVVAASEKAATLAAKYNTSVGKNAATQAAGYATEATTFVNTKVTKQKQTMIGAGVGVLALGLFMFGTKKRK
ncbi:MAG: hypothetical protein RIS29_2507 [Bacteroidota bacterium]|jgi:hypothetical protein